MLHAAADRGWIDLHAAMIESTIALRRAGASMILTYFARELAMHLSGRALQESARV
jgi:porphobilinogen synthase